MSRQSEIETCIARNLNPTWLEVVNESGNHNVPAGSETHFKVTVVSDAFAGKRLVQRHQLIYTLLQGQLDAGLHALAQHCYTPEEWAEKGGSPASPACLGGSGK